MNKDLKGPNNLAKSTSNLDRGLIWMRDYLSRNNLILNRSEKWLQKYYQKYQLIKTDCLTDWKQLFDKTKSDRKQITENNSLARPTI